MSIIGHCMIQVRFCVYPWKLLYKFCLLGRDISLVFPLHPTGKKCSTSEWILSMIQVCIEGFQCKMYPKIAIYAIYHHTNTWRKGKGSCWQPRPPLFGPFKLFRGLGALIKLDHFLVQCTKTNNHHPLKRVENSLQIYVHDIWSFFRSYRWNKSLQELSLKLYKVDSLHFAFASYHWPFLEKATLAVMHQSNFACNPKLRWFQNRFKWC